MKKKDPAEGVWEKKMRRAELKVVGDGGLGLDPKTV